ncbi:hypothetical protein K458DRAFT_471271 [Lentithecium fluviatile CBS 122367]|uniref:Methyltransferase type 11 domain-containing protein n=1 Tax=Lentithecium fluviatile CBS 122367 TaxID=1168545 RepID=A0A6G1IBP7_9PLEO|nr:hypothetical protein K458DRAFT_471271 [Lentithecium fluviatile CBS 122367]
MSTTPFIPKQAQEALAVGPAAIWKELYGDLMDELARNLLSLAPPITAISKIHDNGCGNALAELQKAVVADSWPVTTEVVDSNKLTFPDGSFDLSITNMVFAAFKNGTEDVQAAKEIKRTLKPGGPANANAFDHNPRNTIIRDAHHATRGKDAASLPAMYFAYYESSYFRKALGDAEWDSVRYVNSGVWVEIKDLQRFANIAWAVTGQPSTGWTEEDEKNWDNATSTIIPGLQEGRGNGFIEKDGTHHVRSIVTTALLQK